MNTANYIKDSISLPDAFERYGIERHKKMYICPFHSEKTASVSLYNDNRRFHCFGCGADGTVIDLVMQMFGLNYGQAITKISYDFSISLPGKKMSINEKNKYAREEAERRSKKAEREQYAKSVERDYWEAFDTWKRLADIKEAYRPKTFTDQLHPNYVKAIRLLPAAEYQLDYMTERRRELEQHHNPGLGCG